VSESESDLLQAAEAWAEQDPDAHTRAELLELISAARAGASAALAELGDRFSGPLSFGTAGLRGALGAGPHRMNRVVVAQAAVGLARFLLAREEAGAPTVVVGYDARTNSAIFAKDSAELLSGQGLRALLMPRMLPTPVLAFAVRHLGAQAGVMVTASHNPAGDNGYKVYLGDADGGSQIISPTDAAIAASIARVSQGEQVGNLPRGPVELVDESVIGAYVALTAAAVPQPSAPVRTVYTALHGVGHETFAAVLEAAGFAQPTVVAEQNEPDPAFPTVAYPNPEEQGAMDAVLAVARAERAELVLAHDPDADRLAVAIPDATRASGFRQLTGNEVGGLLGWWAARRYTAHTVPTAGTPPGTLACSLVSSPALQAVAEHYGLGFRWTAPGFKWISRVPHLVFGYEEALGYLINPQTLRDKDGISAGLAMLSLASDLASRGLTLAAHLEDFSTTFGHFASDQVSLRVPDRTRILSLMDALRHSAPTSLGTASVRSLDDFREGRDGLPASNTLRLWLDDGSRVMLRPSGTEPKLKVYLDVVSNHGSYAERVADCDARLGELRGAVRALVGE
jgi:phosphomannomutase